MKTMMMRTALVLTLAATVLVGGSGCVSLIDAGFRELADDGDDARYENKNFGEHFLDSLGEDDDDDCGCHGHHRCHHHA